MAPAQMPLEFIAGFTSLLFYGFFPRGAWIRGSHYTSLVVGWLEQAASANGNKAHQGNNCYSPVQFDLGQNISRWILM